MTDRRLDLDGLLNARDLGGLATADGRRLRPGRVVRSDDLSALTPDATVALVRRLAPRLVVDLRTEQECLREGRGLSAEPDVRWVNLPLQPLAAVTPEQEAQGLATSLLEDYRRQLQVNGAPLLAALRLLAEPDGLPAVVHCTAGKDRTGLVVALLLDLLGVEAEQIVADYVLTADNMDRVRARIRASAYFRGNGLSEAPAWVFAAEAATMRDFLQHLHDDLGGAAGWARTQGLSAAEVDTLVGDLRTALLEPA